MNLSNNEVPSPYEGLAPGQWHDKTLELVETHPLDTEEIVEIVLKAWSDIFTSAIGEKPFRIGVHIFPGPQIMSAFLHELIPLELADRYPGIWRPQETSADKDLVYIPDELFSVEIKASSSARQIFGNRSYAQVARTTKKSKAGYYLGINFGRLSKDNPKPAITRVRFGWLDHEDWLGQQAATGQQARLNREADRHKMVVLY